jgi:hypothetical protein
MISNSRMISCGACARRIRDAPAPILLPDTSALFDLMREPSREKMSAADITAAIGFLRQATTRPRSMWIALPEQVLLEVRTNKRSIRSQAERDLRRLDASLQKVRSIMDAHGLQISDLSPNLLATDFLRRTEQLVDGVQAAALLFSTPRTVPKKAFARVATGTAPARTGKEAKDCVIIESYFQLASQLRSLGVTEKIIFLTSNTNDYSDELKTASIHPQLAADFRTVRMEFAVNYSMAASLFR